MYYKLNNNTELDMDQYKTVFNNVFAGQQNRLLCEPSKNKKQRTKITHLKKKKI